MTPGETAELLREAAAPAVVAQVQPPPSPAPSRGGR